MHHHLHTDASVYGVGAFFLLGVVGSLHCLGMCGPLSSVLLVGKQAVFSGIAIYQGARLIAYSALGLGLHMIGRSVDLLLSFPLAFALAASVLLLYAFGVSIPVPRPLVAAYARLNQHSRQSHPAWRALVLGLLTPLLPCGLLYGALAASLAAPHSPTAALWMASFAAGTIPLLSLGQSGIHIVSRHLSPARYQLITRLLALAALAMILIFYWHHHL